MQSRHSYKKLEITFLDYNQSYTSFKNSDQAFVDILYISDAVAVGLFPAVHLSLRIRLA